MSPLSFARITSALLQLSLVFAQAPISLPSAASEVTASTSIDCGGCFIVASFAGIVFGTEVITQTKTVLSSVGIGPNGSRTTVTSLTTGFSTFTFDPNGLQGSTATAGSSFEFSPTLTISGATLTSPTAYDVFTAYAVTSQQISNGRCITVTGTTRSLPSAFAVARAPGQPLDVFARSAESAFISQVGFFQCSGTGSGSTTSVISITTTTTTHVTTGTLRLTPLPQTTAAPASTRLTVAPKTTASVTISSSSTNVSSVPIPTSSSTTSSTTTTTSSSTSSTSTTSSTSSSKANLPLPLRTTSTQSPSSPSNPLPTTQSTTRATATGSKRTTIASTGFPGPTIIPFPGDATGRPESRMALLGWGVGVLGLGMGVGFGMI